MIDPTDFVKELRKMMGKGKDDDIAAVVSFVLRHDEEEGYNVKVLALMPPQSADEIAPILHEAFDAVIERQQEMEEEQVSPSDDLAMAIHGVPFNELPAATAALWRFNDDLGELLDVLTDKDLVRPQVQAYYTALCSFAKTGNCLVSPALKDMFMAGPEVHGGEVPAICWIVLAHTQDIDPLNPPDRWPEADGVAVTATCTRFLMHVGDQIFEEAGK